MVITVELMFKYRDYFKNLTDESVEGYRNLTTPDVRYRDPFVDAKGIDAVTAYMHKWFLSFDELQFILQDSAVDMDGLIGFGDWIMKFRLPRDPKKLWEIEGASKATFNEDGKVYDHIDYWDPSSLYESVPILGKAVTIIKRSAN